MCLWLVSKSIIFSIIFSHCPLSIWKKKVDIFSPISGALHLMQHYIIMFLNQRLNVWFSSYHWGSLLLTPLISMWYNPTPFFIFLLITHVSWPKNPHDFVPRNFTNIPLLKHHKFCTIAISFWCNLFTIFNMWVVFSSNDLFQKSCLRNLIICQGKC